MKRRITYAVTFLIALIALAPPAGAMRHESASDPVAKANAADARALKEAEKKLAALVREGQAASAAPPSGAEGPAGSYPVVQPAPKKATAPKKPVKAAKKRAAKKSSVARAKSEPVKVHKVYHRRLTEGEVEGILSSTRDFSGADMSGMTLVGMDLTGVKLNRANLKMANLERVDLAESDLELADLSGANLSGASLNQARLRGTRLEGTRLDGALWIDKTICRKGSVGTCIE